MYGCYVFCIISNFLYYQIQHSFFFSGSLTVNGLIVIFTVVSLCVCFNVFYLICHNNNNNALQNNNSEGLPVTYTDSLTYIK